MSSKGGRQAGKDSRHLGVLCKFPHCLWSFVCLSSPHAESKVFLVSRKQFCQKRDGELKKTVALWNDAQKGRRVNV